MNALAESQLIKYKGKILWLASYVKSGNTWFRAFLTALFYGDTFDVNNLFIDNIFSDRYIFDELTSINSRLLTHKEILQYRPELYDYYAHHVEADRLKFLKIHDKLSSDAPPFINPSNTLASIYILRNPLSVAPSLAKHLNKSIDYAIAMMNDPNAGLGPQYFKGLNTISQFDQPWGTWGQHVTSWANNQLAPTYVIRYEDLKEKPLESFSGILKQVGFDFPLPQIEAAIEATQFEKLKQQEIERGFTEKPIHPNKFFRSGKVDGWKEELTLKQQETIIKHHQIVMEQFGYL